MERSNGHHHGTDPPEWNKGKVNIKATELKKVCEIAQGRYGTVYKGECRGQVVAIKMLHNQHLSQEKLEELRTEVEIMSRLRHPCILLFMGICTEPDNISLVMEYVEGKSLDRILHNHNITLSDAKKLHLAKDTAKGLNWLHCLDPPIIHRDLKPPNILVGSQFNVKVCDFGLSCVKELRERDPDDLEDTAVGSPIWMAPEVLSGHPNTEKSDVYAYGIILWEIITRKAPFSDVTSFDQFLKDIVDHHKRPLLPDEILPSLRKLVEDCWAPDPKKRPSFAHILKRLDEITLESLISDEMGRKLWSQLSRKESVGEGYPFFVKWDDFIIELSNHLGIKDKQSNSTGAQCLRVYLSEQYQDETTEKEVRIVRCEEFGNFLKCFGPLETGPGSSNHIVQKFQDVCESRWFFGAVDTQLAEKKLKGDRGNMKKGTFMVRDSSNKTCFTITKVAKDKTIVHQRVQNLNGVFTVQVGKKNVKKPTLVELINEVTEELYLRTAFAGENPFSYIFNQKPGVTGESPIYITCDINQLKEQVVKSAGTGGGPANGDRQGSGESLESGDNETESQNGNNYAEGNSGSGTKKKSRKGAGEDSEEGSTKEKKKKKKRTPKEKSSTRDSGDGKKRTTTKKKKEKKSEG